MSCLILLAVLPAALVAEELSPAHRQEIEPLIAACKSGKREEIMKLIAVPFYRGPNNHRYPLTTIRSEQELSEKFSELLDDKLIKAIAESDVDRDYALAGWRGIMFKGGIFWVDGGKINAINYTTRQGADVYRLLVDTDRLTLPVEYRDYSRPLLRFTTATRIVRVDEIHDSYRLMVFDRQQTDVPTEVLYNGGELDGGTIRNLNLVWLKNDHLCFVSCPADCEIDDHEMTYSEAMIADGAHLRERLSEENLTTAQLAAPPTATPAASGTPAAEPAAAGDGK